MIFEVDIQGMKVSLECNIDSANTNQLMHACEIALYGRPLEENDRVIPDKDGKPILETPEHRKEVNRQRKSLGLDPL